MIPNHYADTISPSSPYYTGPANPDTTVADETRLMAQEINELLKDETAAEYQDGETDVCGHYRLRYVPHTGEWQVKITDRSGNELYLFRTTKKTLLEIISRYYRQLNTPRWM